GVWFAVRASVVVDDQGIRVRNFSRSRRLPWDAIDHVECGEIDRRLLTFFAPIVVLVPEKSKQPSYFGLPKATTLVAERRPLIVLGSYREGTVQGRAQQLVADQTCD